MDCPFYSVKRQGRPCVLSLLYLFYRLESPSVNLCVNLCFSSCYFLMVHDYKQQHCSLSCYSVPQTQHCYVGSSIQLSGQFMPGFIAWIPENNNTEESRNKVSADTRIFVIITYICSLYVLTLSILYIDNMASIAKKYRIKSFMMVRYSLVCRKGQTTV